MLIEGPIIAVHDGAAALDTCHALIGPHAVIHSVAVMRERLGDGATGDILANAQIAHIPTGEKMIAELDVLRLHRWLALREPIACFEIATEAARRTADYIIANRIPASAVRLLQVLPASMAAPLLMMAIRHHAWTFIGAGQFRPEGAWHFVIDRRQCDDPVKPPETLFHWYAKVFERLYKRLVAADCRCQPEASPDCWTYRILRGCAAETEVAA